MHLFFRASRARSASRSTPLHNSSPSTKRNRTSPAILETLEGRTLLDAAVTSLTLINADTDRDLMTLANGAVLDFKTLPTRNLSVRANVAGTVESVRYALDSNLYFRTDNTAPYSLAGDNGLGNYAGYVFSLGSHTIRATPYSLDNAAGIAGSALTISFTVVENNLPALPQSTINQAIAYPLIRYNRYILGGAHTNQPAGGGAPLVLALAAQAGNTSADTRLLEQIRYTLAGGNEITATGGYPAEHERHITSMFAVVRQVPRIWNQLTSTEKTKIDLLMKAALVASAFTTSDNNPYILSGQHERALDGDTNLGRAWNPNYREGMIGAMLVGMAYFGGPQAASQILDNYDHAAFVNQLKSYGLTNIYETFNWAAAHPTGGAPTGAVIQAGIRNYHIWGLPLSNYMGIYWALASNTYGKTVNAGLNGGAGINGACRIITGASTLPNKGVLGMLAEFDSADANGPRSSATYAYDGYRVNQENLLTLIATGYWQPSTSQATNAISRLKIGVPDLWYKIDHGYSNYAKGAYAGTLTSSATDRGFEFTRPLWQNVLKPYLGL